MDKQTIFFNKKGILVSSCDTLFSTLGWESDALLHYSPLLSSIFVRIAAMQSTDEKVIHIPKVESPLGAVDKFYDFTFSCIEKEGEEFIEWVIHDHTSKYRDLQQQQQSLHNKSIQEEEKIKEK